MWSEAGEERCFKRLVKYLAWDDLTSVLLTFCSMAGLLVTLGILALFLHHSDTPVVRSAGGWLCFLMLPCLSIAFCSIPFSVGVPTDAKCLCRQTLFGLCFTTCVSCITVRSFQIVCAFKMAARLPRAHQFWMKHKGQEVSIGLISAAKFILVGATVYFHRPGLVEPTVSNSDPAVMYLVCNYESNIIAHSIFDMVLAFLCFCFAYMGKALPKNYNEAKYVTLSLIGYFSSCVALFLVVCLFEGVVVTVFDAAAALSNLFGITLGYFGPKCYVILFRPEQNTTAFFQTAIQSYTTRHD